MLLYIIYTYLIKQLQVKTILTNLDLAVLSPQFYTNMIYLLSGYINLDLLKILFTDCSSGKMLFMS